MSMKPGMNNTLTNNISQHPGVDPSGGIRGAESSVSNTGLGVVMPPVAPLKWQVKMSCSHKD